MIRVCVARLGALFLVLFTMTATAFAHGVPTHVNITNAAVDYLQQLALTRVEGVDQRFACKTDLKQQLIPGVTLEDDLNLDRPIRHFNPSLTAAVADCSSTNWGFNIRNCTGLGRTLTNWHQWRDAINAANPAGEGWYELGWVIHLLQDLTSPAHTRDDAHLIIPIGNRLFMDVDGDPLEMKERIPSMPPLGPLMNISDVEDFFEAIQSTVQRSSSAPVPCLKHQASMCPKPSTISPITTIKVSRSPIKIGVTTCFLLRTAISIQDSRQSMRPSQRGSGIASGLSLSGLPPP